VFHRGMVMVSAWEFSVPAAQQEGAYRLREEGMVEPEKLKPFDCLAPE